MPKASPMIRSMNAGVFSALMSGRVDYDKYPASLTDLVNFITTTQGPAIRRSGTEYVVPVYDETKRSALVPFEYSEADALDVEFAEGRCRFILDEGIQTYALVTVTASPVAANLVLTAAGLGAAINDQVVLDGFTGILANRVLTVTNVAGNDYTLNIARPVGFVLPASPKLGRVYHIDNPFGTSELEAITALQDASFLYVFTGSVPKKLYRVSDFDWHLEDMAFVDGPFLPTNETSTKLAFAAVANPIPVMTSTTLPSGTVSGDAGTAGFENWKMFDGNYGSHWRSTVNQGGAVEYTFPAAKTLTGYTMFIPPSSDDASYKHTDYAPSTFTFDAWDGAAWVTLHSQTNYVVWDNNRSAFFQFENSTAYTKYRIAVSACVRNGPIAPRIAQLYTVEDAAGTVAVTASAVAGINGGAGFQATDVGRLLRVKGVDGTWRPLKITARTSTTQVSAQAQKEPIFEPVSTKEWRLGMFSDTTGWPTCGVFFDDRLYLGGVRDEATTLAGSKPGAYETFSPTDPDGTVNDDNGIVLRLKARKLSDIRWLATDERGLLVGTGSGEWVVTSAALNEALTARSVKARQATSRGSARVAPAKVDRVVIFAQRAARTLREFAYAYDQDGYKSPSMSLFASHLGASAFVELDYAAEPYSIIWGRKADGDLNGFTYNREENATGWHVHQTKNGQFESLSIRRSKARTQDMLTFTVHRTVGGVERRFIERLRPFWDFGMSLDDAFFVDCGFEAAVSGQFVSGVPYLAGETVHCLVDGYPVKNLVVDANGVIDLGVNGVAVAKVIGGIPLSAFGLTSRLEAGAADGTAQGKLKRIDRVVVRVWDTLGGKVGKVHPETGLIEADPLATRKLADALGALVPVTGDIELTAFPSGYDFDGRVWFGTDDPLPFNLVAIMPRVQSN